MASATGTHVIEDTLIEGMDYKTMARLVGIDDSQVLQADVTALTLNVYEVTGDTPGTNLTTADATFTEATGGPNGEAVILDTLDTGEGWDADSTGYNFQHIYDFTDDAEYGTGTALTVQGGQRYHLEYTIDTSGGTTDSGLLFVIVKLDILPRSGG